MAIFSGFATSDLALPAERVGFPVAFGMYVFPVHECRPTDVDGVLGGFVFVDVDDSVEAVVSGDVQLGLTSGIDFFERMHVVPRSFSFGQVLSAQQADIEVFNGYRKTFITWTAFVPVPDPGTDLLGFPGVPDMIAPLDGVQMQVDVSSIGAPLVDDEMEFVFSDGSTILVPVEISRIVLFFPRPELPFVEVLEWITDVQRASRGNEVRPSVRQYPRQEFEFDYILDEDPDRMALEAAIFDWQSQAFGIPVWYDETFLSSAATAGASVLNVVSTAFMDYRVGGLVVVFQDRKAFDVQTVVSFTATTITLENPILNSYAAGVSVMPVRTARASGESLEGERYPVTLAELSATWEIEDNIVDIASVAGFSSVNGKVLLDDPNALRGTSGEAYRRRMYVLDGDTGVVERVAPEDRSRRASNKTFVARGRQAVWELRQLFHALRGRQVSFYLPRFRDDLVPVLNLVSGSAALDVSNIGYTQFVRARQPLNFIRIAFNNGAPTLFRTISSSIAVDADRETLTLTATWPSTFTPAQVERIDFVEKVRLDSDRVRIEYDLGGFVARARVPVLVVLE